MSLGILNVGAGDVKLSFDPKNPAERERAAQIVADMLKRGYAILVQVDIKNGEPVYQRAKAFDPETCEYIVAGGPDEAVSVGAILEREKGEVGTRAEEQTKRRGRGRPRNDEVRIPAASTRAVSVSRSAGG